MSDGPYKSCITGKDTLPPAFGVDGPGTGFGFHGWYLFPQNTLPTMTDAEQVARMMNIAFRQGELHRASQIAELLR